MLTKKKAYISIEEGKAKVFLLRDQFFEIESKELISFLNEKGIKEAVISQFLSNLITFKFILPFTAKSLTKKKVLDGIIMSEIRKRYPTLSNFAFNYQIYDGEGGRYVRCYILDDENFDTVNNLFINNIDIKGFYPSFFSIVELLRANNLLTDEGFIVCLISDNIRFLYVFRKDELLLQRSYEGSSSKIEEDDILNINVTVSYSLQNLRIKPERVIFIGAERQDINGLKVSYDFIENFQIEKKYNSAYLLHILEGKLKGKELLLTEHKKFINKRNYFKYASAFLGSLAIILAIYNVSLFGKVVNNYQSINMLKKQINSKQSDFNLLQEKILFFDKNIKPLISLQNKRNIEGGVKASIYPVSQASQVKGIEITSLDIENNISPKIKIVGKILGMSYSEKHLVYNEFKHKLVQNGLKILSEQMELTKEDFSIEGEYDTKGLLQR